MIPETPAVEIAPEQLDCLDGLRGVAVLLVILFHLGSVDMGEFHPAIKIALSPFRLGGTGVHLFLVLSGFCLTHSALRRSRAGKTPAYRTYMAARWRRIAPPYYAAIFLYLIIPTVALLLGHPGNLAGELTFRQISLHVCFLHGLFGDTINAINTPFWSLSLEFQFYLVLPLLLAGVARVGATTMILSVAVATIIFRFIVLAYFQEHSHLVNGFLLGRLTEFALGIGVARWYDGQAQVRSSRLISPAIVSAVAFFIAGALTMQTSCDFVADIAFGLAYASLLIAVLVGVEHSAWFRRTFEQPALVWVGVISYSLYLSHGLVLVRGVQVYRLTGLPKTAADLVIFPAILALVFAFGWTFHVLVERRFLRSARHLPSPLPNTKPSREPDPHERQR